jgi:CheY-like chemotaxis protein
MQAQDFQANDLFAQIQGLVQALAAERQAREAAEADDAAKSELLTIVSRELCAPMEAVVAMAELVLDSELDAAQRRNSETLLQSARSLLSSLTEVTDFATLETGDAELATERFDLHALVKAAASELQARASAKGLTTGVDMAANCPRFIIGDEARVRQVLMGLIEAALQSTSEGSIRLYASINDAETPFTVRFDVTDTGAGLCAAERARLFQPMAHTSRAGGRLGLPIAQRLAEAMGGDVGCDSVLGQGSLYWFTFRAVEAKEESVTQGDQEKTAASKGTLSGHVLVVEDNTVNRMLIGTYLDEFGLTYEVVDSGAAALMCLVARPYDLILMDTVLPDYDGLKIAKQIRALHAPSSEVPIVGIAARGAEEDNLAYVLAGINARVAKPIQGRALHAALVPFLAGKDEPVPVAKAS